MSPDTSLPVCNMKVNDTGYSTLKCDIRMRETMNTKTSRKVRGMKEIEGVIISFTHLRTIYSFVFSLWDTFDIYGVLLFFRLCA